LSALRSLAAPGREFGYFAFDLATKNVRSAAYRDTRGPEPEIMVVLLEYAKTQPHRAKAARDAAMLLLAALDERSRNVRAAREFSGHASIEVLMQYDDNRNDVGGEVAGRVVRRVV
jgi:hypothetical protein